MRKIILKNCETVKYPDFANEVEKLNLRRFIAYHDNKRNLIVLTNCRNANAVKSVLRQCLYVDDVDMAEIDHEFFILKFADKKNALMIDTEEKENCAIVYFVQEERDDTERKD